MRNSTQTQNLFAMKQITLLFASLLIAACTFAGVSIDWMRMPDLAANKGTAIARDASDNVYTTTSTGSIILEKGTALATFSGRLHPSLRFRLTTSSRYRSILTRMAMLWWLVIATPFPVKDILPMR